VVNIIGMLGKVDPSSEKPCRGRKGRQSAESLGEKKGMGRHGKRRATDRSPPGRRHSDLFSILAFTVLGRGKKKISTDGAFTGRFV